VFKSVSISFEQKYMQVALKLARQGISVVEPNPAVGAVIVKNSQIIGRGWHKKFGGPHAEINALEDCRKKGASPQGATMYVTLEPCCHYGKTPPCTDAIIAAGLSKVVVATIDPSEHANGKGAEKLRDVGIEVEVGVCEKEARLLNAPFFKFATTGKCWVTLKWAQTIDGKLVYTETSHESQVTSREIRWISNEQSRKDAHKLRRRVGGVLVGINTIIVDDPLLTPRPARGKKPIRIVLDSTLRIPLDCRLLATAKKTPVLIVTGEGAVQANPEVADKITKKGAEIVAVPVLQGRCDIKYLLDELSRRGIQQLLVEGGATVLTTLLKEQLADEIIVYIAPKILGSQGDADIAAPMAELTKVVGLNYVDIKRFGDNIRLTGLTENALSIVVSLGKAHIESDAANERAEP
jgi:diaminohydroxyphosphoribosylaminopyrimidine deaminase/5-amino-6-(5-phosphoribosylamino)uracil reductase